jgi:hypothetical protein
MMLRSKQLTSTGSRWGLGLAAIGAAIALAACAGPTSPAAPPPAAPPAGDPAAGNPPAADPPADPPAGAPREGSYGALAADIESRMTRSLDCSNGLLIESSDNVFVVENAECAILDFAGNNNTIYYVEREAGTTTTDVGNGNTLQQIPAS